MTTEAQANISGGEARRAARNAGTLAAASIISKGALFGWQLVLAPLLAPETFGVYGTVLALLTVGATIPNFGLGVILIRDVARAPQQAGRYLSATLFMQTLLALVAYVGINLAAFGLGYSPTIRVFVAIAGISLFVDIVGSVCHDVLLARERMVATSIVDIGHIGFRIGLAALALLAGFDLLGIYIAAIIAGMLRSAILWALVLRSGVRPHWPLDRLIAGPLLLNSIPLALNALLLQTYSQVDKLMSTRFLGAEGTGFLTAAFILIVGMVELLSTTVLTAIYPLMSRAYGEGDDPLFGFMAGKMAFFTLLISLPITLALSLFAADVTAIFGAAFRPTAGVLRILVWFALATMVTNVFTQALLVQNRQRRTLEIRAGGLAVNITLNLLLLPRIGVEGAAIASVIAEIVVLGAVLWNFRAAGWDWRELPPRLLRVMLLGSATALAMLLGGALHFIAGVAVGSLVYTAGIFGAGILATDDWDLLYRLTAAMPGGSLALRYWRRDVEVSI